MAVRGHDRVRGVDDSRNGCLGQQPFRACTQGLGQGPVKRRSGGVDSSVGFRDVEGRAAFGFWERRQERIGLGGG